MMKIITIKLPQELIDSIDELVVVGKYKNRSQLIRKAVEDLIIKETWHTSLIPGLASDEV